MLSQLMPKATAVVTDGGRFIRPSWKYFEALDASLNVETNNFGSIGLGLATAVGVASARPDLVTIGAVGDGGGMMGIKEFSTAVRNRLPLAVIVFNDGAYGAEFNKLKEYGGDRRHALMNWPSFAAMASAMGGTGYRVTSREDIAALPRDLFHHDRLPALVEIVADPNIDLQA
jgi:acetolactate synthase-1/2/3 large subunit